MSRNPTVVFAGPEQVVVEDRAMPTPGPGELLARTRCTLISTGTELTILRGKSPAGSGWAQYGQFPFLPGYNNIGEVVDVGPGTEKEWIGRRVATYGIHAQYVCTKAEGARQIPSGIADEQAAFFTIAEIVMNGIRRGNVRWGEVVVVFGVGLLGQLAVRFCRLCGARPVIAVDVAESRLCRLPQDPAIVRVQPGKDQAASAVRMASRGRMADVAFEVTGNPDLIPEAIRVLRGQGRFVLLSSPQGTTQFDFHDLCNAPSWTIIGAHNMSHPPCETPDNPWTMRRHAELFFDLVAAGEVRLESLISHHERYTQARQLYQSLLRDRSQAMGVILDWKE